MLPRQRMPHSSEPTSRDPAFLALANNQEMVLWSANPASHLSILSFICYYLQLSLQSLAYTNFLIQRATWHNILVSSLLYVTCESVSYSILCQQHLFNAKSGRLYLSTYIRTIKVVTFKVRQLCLLIIAYVFFAQNSLILLTIKGIVL
jgi:hypothetical protein